MPKRKQGRRPARRKTARRGRGLLKLGLFAVTGLILVFAGYMLHLDRQVREQFEGKSWALPARVYARPLELYVGKALTTAQFATYLQALGYRKSSRSQSPGSFRQGGDTFHVHVRRFRFWDGDEPERSVALTVTNGRISDLRIDSGPKSGLVRLEPAVIAGIYPAHHEDRILVRLEEVPKLLLKGLVTVEDREFYDHPGVDVSAIIRAFFANIRAGRTVQGGSTLTQQLVKNFFLSSEKTLRRKFVEVLMSLLVELHYDKDAILEAYCNEVYVGQDGERAIHGFGLASHFFFERPIQELDIQEIALLVGLIKGPSYYDPRRHPERARERRNLVLQIMAEQGVIPTAVAERASRQPLGVTSRLRGGITQYPAFLDLVRRQLQSDYREEDLTNEGLQIFTTIDLDVQRSAESALADGLPILERRHGFEPGILEGAAIYSDPQSGEVLALVGGRDVRLSGFNRALDARRQIGSIIKPLVYLLALSRPGQFNLLSLLEDEPFTVRDQVGNVWSPRNYDDKFHGRVLLREALARSYNVASARLGLDLGIDAVVEGLERYGVQRDLKPYPSLLLGALELSAFEVSELYQPLANGGFRTPLRAIREVVAADGEPLQRYALTVEQVAPPGPVYLLNRALQDVIRYGSGRSLLQKVPEGWNMAGKTGTSSRLRDSWFAGYSGNLLGVVWLGRDDDRPAGLSGASGALRIFGDAVKGLGLMPLTLRRPADVETVWVDSASGELTDSYCPGAMQAPYIRGYAPAVRSQCVIAPPPEDTPAPEYERHGKEEQNWSWRFWR